LRIVSFGLPKVVAAGHPRELGGDERALAFVQVTTVDILGDDIPDSIRAAERLGARLYASSATCPVAVAAERDKQVAEWVRLTDEKRKLVQVAPVSSQLATKPQGGRPEGGMAGRSKRQIVVC